METELKNFLESINDSKIVTIGGGAGTGKSIISSIICEYFLMKNKYCIVFDSNMDNTIPDRLIKSKNVSHKLQNFQNVVLNDLDSLLYVIEQIKDCLIIIDDFSGFKSPVKKEDDGIASRAKYIKAYLDKIRNNAIKNNNIFILTAHTFIDFSSNAQTIKYHNNNMVYTSDIVATCYRDKDNDLKFRVEKSRFRDISVNLPILNLSKYIKGIIRKEKISKLLAEN